jgi:hypothetical protein
MQKGWLVPMAATGAVPANASPPPASRAKTRLRTKLRIIASCGRGLLGSVETLTAQPKPDRRVPVNSRYRASTYGVLWQHVTTSAGRHRTESIGSTAGPVRLWRPNGLETNRFRAHICAMNRSPITVIVAGLIIAVALAFLFRWHVISSSIGVQRLDRWTGKIQFCSQANGKVICVDE